MSWRLASSLAVLRMEVDQRWPARSRRSDGTVGDLSHQSRQSDHNPFIKDGKGVGVVRAIDITHDPHNGPDASDVAEHLRTLGHSGDPRVSYVISNARIASSRQGWAWRPYSGVNAHRQHVHLSVSTQPRYYDSTAPWGIADEGLTVADISKILDRLSDGYRRVEFCIEAVLQCRNRLDNLSASQAGMERRFAAELDELRRNVRRVSVAAGYPVDLVEGADGTLAQDAVDPAGLPLARIKAIAVPDAAQDS